MRKATPITPSTISDTSEPYGESSISFGGPGTSAHVLLEAYCGSNAGSMGGASATIFGGGAYGVQVTSSGPLSDFLQFDLFNTQDYSCYLLAWGAYGGGGYAYLSIQPF